MCSWAEGVDLQLHPSGLCIRPLHIMFCTHHFCFASPTVPAENLLRGAVKDPKREQGHRALGDCRDLCIVLPRMLELGQERGLMVPGSAFARARDIAPIKPKSDSSASGDGDLKRGKISAR